MTVISTDHGPVPIWGRRSYETRPDRLACGELMLFRFGQARQFSGPSPALAEMKRHLKYHMQ